MYQEAARLRQRLQETSMFCWERLFLAQLITSQELYKSIRNRNTTPINPDRDLKNRKL